jgi:hypothetical protein
MVARNLNIAKIGTWTGAFLGASYLIHVAWMEYSRQREMKLLEAAKKEIYDEYPELRPYVNLNRDDFNEYADQYKLKMEKKNEKKSDEK